MGADLTDPKPQAGRAAPFRSTGLADASIGFSLVLLPTYLVFLSGNRNLQPFVFVGSSLLAVVFWVLRALRNPLRNCPEAPIRHKVIRRALVVLWVMATARVVAGAVSMTGVRDFLPVSGGYALGTGLLFLGSAVAVTFAKNLPALAFSLLPSVLWGLEVVAMAGIMARYWTSVWFVGLTVLWVSGLGVWFDGLGALRGTRRGAQ